MPSSAVGADLKVLSTSLAFMPLVKGVNFLGSNVSVWAIPPPIQSKITVSAVAVILGRLQEDKKPAIGAPAASAAIEAALLPLINSLRFHRVLISNNLLSNDLINNLKFR